MAPLARFPELSMRVGLVILLCLLNVGCAILRKDKEEKVETRQDRQQAEEVLKPSEALKPESSELASPVSDHFYMRLTYFQPTLQTQLRVDSTGSDAPDGTLLSAEEDLGLDDVADQARLEFDIRMGERNHLRVDYFKLNRFQQSRLARDIEFGDFTFNAGDTFRATLDWRVLSLTYTYSLLKSERFEAGLGLGIHLLEVKAEGSEPGTLNREGDSEVGAAPTIAANAAFRISKRWAITARAQQFKLERDNEFSGEMSDFHADIQYRWRKNFAVGLGYTSLVTNLDIIDADQPFMFDMDASGPELFFRASF
jgi:hypothetical protein